MNKNILNKMGVEVLGQMVANEDISNNFSSGLKQKVLKIGATALVAAVMATSTGMVHAENAGTRNTTMGITALFGFLTSDSKPSDIPSHCNVEGSNGWLVGGAGVGGALIGNQIGSGNGNKAATIIGGIAGAGLMQGAEHERIRRECAQQMQERKSVNGIPYYATTDEASYSPIMYEAESVNGTTFFVTMQDSPGVRALKGEIVGKLDPASNKVVKNAIEKGGHSLISSYQHLEKTAQHYMKVSSGNTELGKRVRYAIEDNEVGADSPLIRQHQEIIEKAKYDFNEAYSEFSRKRGTYINSLDYIAEDGYNLQHYHGITQFFTPPESAALAYDGKLPNRFVKVNKIFKP